MDEREREELAKVAQEVYRLAGVGGFASVEWDALGPHGKELWTRIAAAVAEARDREWRKLEPYIQHLGGCGSKIDGDPYRCICGLSRVRVVLAGPAGGEQGETS